MVIRFKTILKLFFSFSLINLVGNFAYGYSSVSAGGFQGYQVIFQNESLYKTTSTMASLPTIGIQFQFQTTLGDWYGLRLKYEAINVKFQPPDQGFLSDQTFKTTNVTVEIPFQHSIHWQSFLKLAKRERILYNIDDNFRFDLYKSKITDIGYGLNYDSQNLGGLVTGVGSTFSLLFFESKDINDTPANNLGVDFEIRGKLGWLYESGWGAILRINFATFYMPNNIDKNTGREIKFFGEFVKSF